MTKPYTTKSGAKQFKPALSWLIENQEESAGFCLACGAEQDGCEPDMRKGECDSCGAAKVYGAEELILMGLFHQDTAHTVDETAHYRAS